MIMMMNGITSLRPGQVYDVRYPLPMVSARPIIGPAIIAPRKESSPPRMTTEKASSPVWISQLLMLLMLDINTPPKAANTQANIHDREKIFVTGIPHACTAFWSSAVARMAMPILL